MEIRNVTQFATFVSPKDLMILDSSFIQIINCVNNFRSMCNCYKPADKAKFYTQCNKLYNDSVRNIVPKFRTQFLSKTNDQGIYFYNDSGSLIGVLTR